MSWFYRQSQEGRAAVIAYDRIRRLTPDQLKAAQSRAMPRKQTGPVQTKAQAQAILMAALGRKQ